MTNSITNHNNNALKFSLESNMDVAVIKTSLTDGSIPLDKITAVFEKKLNVQKNNKQKLYEEAHKISVRVEYLKAKPVKTDGKAVHDEETQLSKDDMEIITSENLISSYKLKENHINSEIKTLQTQLKEFTKAKKQSYGIFGSIILTIGKIFNIGAVARAKQLSKTMLNESNVALIK